MNSPVHSEFACAGVAYGNQASITYQFSYAAILVVVPPSLARVSMVGQPDGRSSGHGVMS